MSCSRQAQEFIGLSIHPKVHLKYLQAFSRGFKSPPYKSVPSFAQRSSFPISMSGQKRHPKNDLKKFFTRRQKYLRIQCILGKISIKTQVNTFTSTKLPLYFCGEIIGFLG